MILNYGSMSVHLDFKPLHCSWYVLWFMDSFLFSYYFHLIHIPYYIHESLLFFNPYLSYPFSFFSSYSFKIFVVKNIFFLPIISFSSPYFPFFYIFFWWSLLKSFARRLGKLLCKKIISIFLVCWIEIMTNHN